MKKKLLAIALVMLMLIGTTSAALADKKVYSNTFSLNDKDGKKGNEEQEEQAEDYSHVIFAGKSEQSTRLGILKDTDDVTVWKIDGQWAQISVAGIKQKGWIYAATVGVQTEEEATEAPAQTPEPEEEGEFEAAPVIMPTEEPTPEPTEEPTPEPTEEPTPEATEEPTPEATEEPTPEPTEEPTPEPTEEPTPEPTPDFPENYTIKVSSNKHGKKVKRNEAITLTATLTGFEGYDYKLQWQYSTDGGKSFRNMAGATGMTYTYKADRKSANYLWRVSVEIG